MQEHRSLRWHFEEQTQMIQPIFLTIFQKVSHFFQIHLGQEMQKKQFVSQDLQEVGCGDFIKIEVIHDSKYLLPDNYETIKATEILAKEGFVVMPYMYPDLNAARDLVNAGAAAIMPLGSPIGSNKGICTKDFVQILIDEIDLPIIVDAGIGKPSQACEAMEMGADAVMVNTAIATAGDIPAMAEAFKNAIEAGRSAYLAGLGRVIEKGSSASSPLTGFLED
jgi:thiazole synthase